MKLTLNLRSPIISLVLLKQSIYDHICLHILMRYRTLHVTLLMCREMKKYKKDFMQSLSCTLLIMKSDNSIKHLRGPREMELYVRRNGNASCVRCKEMSQHDYLDILDFRIIYSCSSTSYRFVDHPRLHKIPIDIQLQTQSIQCR